MAEKLVIVSDMWGMKKGLWITSYFGYLQQYYDIEFYDSQLLGNIDVTVNTEDNVHEAFVNGGIDTAVAHLLKKQKEPAHYLAFSTGGTIAWKAGLKGLPMKSLTALSPTRIRYENHCPTCDMDILFGENDSFRPNATWGKSVGADVEIVPNFGHQLYSDEKIIEEICFRMLQRITTPRKAV